MDFKIKQTVFQVGDETPKRLIVQYTNEQNEDVQTINNYEDLTSEEKEVFDAFKAFSESKMI